MRADQSDQSASPLLIGKHSALRFLAQTSVDAADLLDPAAPIVVLQLQNLRERPMEVVGDEGYLLLELLEGVAYDPPSSLRTSTSNSEEHDGHTAATRLCPFSLIRR